MESERSTKRKMPPSQSPDLDQVASAKRTCQPEDIFTAEEHTSQNKAVNEGLGNLDASNESQLALSIYTVAEFAQMSSLRIELNSLAHYKNLLRDNHDFKTLVQKAVMAKSYNQIREHGG